MTAFDRPLRFAFPLQQGEDVRALQQALHRAGCFGTDADGIFGPATRDALVAFQRQAGLPPDGIADATTCTRLLACAPAAATPADWRDRLRPYLRRLQAWHGAPVGPGTRRWKLTTQGLLLQGEDTPRRTAGTPRTATAAWQHFGPAMQAAAREFGVPVELLLAIACTESGGRPNAIREEAGFTSDAATPHRVSPGLMQTLISTARAALRDDSLDRARLLDAATSLRAGAAYLRGQAIAGRNPTGFDPPLAGAAYNAGSLRASTGNAWGLVQTTYAPDRAYADMLVGFLNDAFAVLAHAPPAAETPSYAALLAQ